MIRSLRWRVQLWYGMILLGVVLSFGAILYMRVRSTRQAEIDGQLQTVAVYLDATLRSFPPRELDEERPEPPPKLWFDKKGGTKDKFGKKDGPWKDDGFGKKDGPPKDDGIGKKDGPRKDDGFGKKDGPKKDDGFGPGPPRPEFPPKKSRDQLLAELVLPRDVESAAPTEAERPYFVVYRGDGTLLKQHQWPSEVDRPPPPPELPEAMRFENRGDYREATVRGPRDSFIVVGRSVARERAELQTFLWQLCAVGAGVLAVGLAGGWFLASRIVKPIASMSATASSISAKHLSERIETSEVDTELAQLADVLNKMFARLEGAFDRQQQFTADASHELRTPIAILRSHAELALSKPRTPDEYRQTLETCLRAANRMNALVQGLLTLARLDGANNDPSYRPVALAPLVNECATMFKPLADQKKIRLTAEVVPVNVAGDADQLVQVLTNLVHNAIQHTPAGGAITIRLSRERDAAVLSVSDTGPGIPPEHRVHIFERFYRVDKSRARASGGVGLGLAICKSIIDAHRGTIGFDSETGRGATFWVRLPLQ